MLTTAIADVVTSEGKQMRLVASSRRTLPPRQRMALGRGEVPVSGSGHATITALRAALKASYKVVAVATNRPMCLDCKKAVERLGGRVVEEGT